MNRYSLCMSCVCLITPLFAAVSIEHGGSSISIDNSVGVRGSDIDIDDINPRVTVNSIDGHGESLILDARDGEYRETIVPTDPKAQAQDFEEAFKRMKKENPSGRVYAIVKGRSIHHITDVKTMAGSSVLLLTVKRGYRTDHESIKVEDIELLGQWGRSESPVSLPDSW